MACSSGISHIIQSGDTLFNLAQQFLGQTATAGTRSRTRMVPRSPKDQARNLQVGQEVCIPSGGKPVPPTGVGFASIVSPQMFDSIFPDRKPIYTFDALLQAIKRFPRFAGEGQHPSRPRVRWPLSSLTFLTRPRGCPGTKSRPRIPTANR